MFDMMRREVTTEVHPEHIAGSGPEQDYLSRFFAAAPWHHISVSYNFQPHHVPFALEYYLQNRSRLDTWLPPRLTMPLRDIRNVHFSGSVKLWERYVPNVTHETDDVFVERLLQSNCESYCRWVERSALSKEDRRVELEHGTDVTPVVDLAVEKIREVVSTAARTWRKCLSRLLVTLGSDDATPPSADQASSQLGESRRPEPERRQAADGKWCTREQFVEFYGNYNT